jgi:ribose transport system permease protein
MSTNKIDVAEVVASAPDVRDRDGGRRGVDSAGYGSRARSMTFRFPVRYRVVWVALAALLLLALVSGRAALNGSSMDLVTALTGILVIASIGQLLVIMLGGIDLSVPAVMTLAAAIVVKETNADNGELLKAVIEAVAAGAVIGMLNGVLVSGLRLNALIVTLAVNGSILGGLRWWTGTSFSVKGTVPQSLNDFATGGPSWISSIFIVAVVLVIGVAAFLRRTRTGRKVIAAGANPAAAQVIGVRVRWLQVAAYAVAGVLYAIAGILIAGYLSTPDATVGGSYQLETVTAVAIGGAALAGGPSSLICTAAGAFFLVLLNQYLDVKGASGGVSVLLQGVVLVAAVAMVTGVSSGRSGLSAMRSIPWLRTRNAAG